MVKQLGLIMLS